MFSSTSPTALVSSYISDGTSIFTPVSLSLPSLKDFDILVEVHAVSINPVDIKMRSRSTKRGRNILLGYDSAGVVVDKGFSVSRFNIGDKVFYSGQINRPGTYASHHIVNEKLVGHMPSTIPFISASSFPLVSLTAWELLFDCFKLDPIVNKNSNLLVIGGAGGVSSMVIQFAKRIFNMNVVATSSRDKTSDWVYRLGADHVINHRQNLKAQLAEINFAPKFVACLNHASFHFSNILEFVEPFAHIGVIDGTVDTTLDLFKQKSLSLSSEYVFAKSLYGTSSMIDQGIFLDQLSSYIDASMISPIVGHTFPNMSPQNLESAHALQSSGSAIGKTVLGPLITSEVNPLN